MSLIAAPSIYEFHIQGETIWSLILLPFCANLYLFVLSCTSCCSAIFSETRQNVS